MSVRSKLDNIWYHYKTYIIASIILIGTVLFGLHSCVTKSEYDIKVYYFAGSSSMYSEQLEWVRTAVGEYCGDANGDGEVNVAVTGIRVGSYSSATTRAEYMTAVQAGEVFLFFGDEAGIQYLYDNNYLQPVRDFTENTAGNGYAWPVNGSGFSALTKGFEMFSDVNLYVALRVSDNTWATSIPSGKKNYETACNTLRNMVAVKAEYDLRAYYLSGGAPLDGNRTAWVQRALLSLASDVNGDGKTVLDVTGLDLFEPSTLGKYTTAITNSPDTFLVIGDEKAIALLGEKGLLESLSDAAEETDPTGYGRLLNGTDFMTTVVGADIFADTKLYVAVRKCPENEDAGMKVLQESARNIFEKMLIKASDGE